ncbi:MAG: imm11 family protein [Anaerolineae bacterium]
MAMKARFYRMLWREDPALGVGYAQGEFGLDLVKEDETYEQWVPVTFVLRDGGYADYQANDFAVRLCSERLRHLIDMHAAPNDVRQWLEAIVVGPGGEAREYHILHLPEPADVLDKRRTLYAEGEFVMKPHLNAARASGRHVFIFPTGGTTAVIVSAKARDAIISARCTGMEFSSVPAT